jgi:hypothetical protein
MESVRKAAPQRAEHPTGELLFSLRSEERSTQKPRRESRGYLLRAPGSTCAEFGCA